MINREVGATEPVHEVTFFSHSNEITMSLLIYPDSAPPRWEVAEFGEEPPQDTFEGFLAGKVGGG